MPRVAEEPARALRRAWMAVPLHAAVTSVAIERGYELYVVGGAVRDVLLGR